MISRIVNCTIDPAKLAEFRNMLNNQFVPRIQSQPGFVDSIESLDPSTGQFCCLTLWKTSSDEQKYASGLSQELSAKMSPLIQGNSTVQTLTVENSTAHHLKAGAAAA